MYASWFDEGIAHTVPKGWLVVGALWLLLAACASAIANYLAQPEPPKGIVRWVDVWAWWVLRFEVLRNWRPRTWWAYWLDVLSHGLLIIGSALVLLGTLLS